MSHTTPLRTTAKPLHERSFAAILKAFGFKLIARNSFRECYRVADTAYAEITPGRCYLNSGMFYLKPREEREPGTLYEATNEGRQALVEALQCRFPEVVV